MKIYKETEIKNPLYITTLDNGATLFVYDGYGEDTDGLLYYPMMKGRGDGDCEMVGWYRKE